MGYLHNEDADSRTFIEFIKDKASIDLATAEKHGSNNDVFYYQFSETDQFGLYMVKLVFYGGVEIFIAFLPDNQEVPFNLGMELMKSGIHTVITLDDKKYEFNKS